MAKDLFSVCGVSSRIGNGKYSQETRFNITGTV